MSELKGGETTELATFQNVLGDVPISNLNDWMRAALAGWAHHFDLARLEQTLKDRLNDELPAGITFTGDRFYGPRSIVESGELPTVITEVIQPAIQRFADEFWELAAPSHLTTAE